MVVCQTGLKKTLFQKTISLVLCIMEWINILPRYSRYSQFLPLQCPRVLFIALEKRTSKDNQAI